MLPDVKLEKRLKVKQNRELTREEIISREAGDLVRKLYNYLLENYVEDSQARNNLDVFCVRLVFLLYAEDSKVFEKGQFHDYLKPRLKMARTAISELFIVLNQKQHERDPYIDDELKAFPYVDGGLFEKSIDPLFMEALTRETDKLIESGASRQKLREFQKKLAGLTFFDPACGSGNFLTETYLSLRKLENRIIRELEKLSYKPRKDEKLILVSISQFYGIEINDFAVRIARTALWIAQAQMWRATQKEDDQQTFIDFYGEYLPLQVRLQARLITWQDGTIKPASSYRTRESRQHLSRRIRLLRASKLRTVQDSLREIQDSH